MSKAWTALTLALLLVACSGGGASGKPTDESVIAAFVVQLVATTKTWEEHSEHHDTSFGPVAREGMKITVPWKKRCQGPYTNNETGEGSFVLTITDIKITPVPESSMQPYRATIAVERTKTQNGFCQQSNPFESSYSSSWSAENKTWGEFKGPFD